MPSRRSGRKPAPRLMLLEFFRGALRRNENSMFFPFLQGLARERDVKTLWLCFGGDIAHLSKAPAGRSLFASLPKDDLRTLAGHLARFRPTHVVTSDVLCQEAQDIAAGQIPPPAILPIPQIKERPRMLAHPVRRGDIVRCGWFLDWLGLENSSRPGPHIVEAAVPDYAAVMANKAARVSTSHITILSGVLCANRRKLTKNPHFAGLDLSGDDHRGCTFCKCPAMPSFTSPRANMLALIDTQFRRILQTAGAARRNKNRYELFDIHAFWKFDEVFKRILRLKIPPAVFLFNPRIDDVLRQRRRIERTLPGLAKAGHEIHILSMGVENFSQKENSRFNKDISVAQVDEFLALTEKWARDHKHVFKPFKGGHRAIELGFILFTPWTKLEDIRINLTHAAARNFPEKGYWLYSILLIESPVPGESPTPIFRLARDENLLVEQYPDHGQLYGLYKNEGEMSTLSAWRFRDPKVADFFAILVRVCAADREGKHCDFFQDDPGFLLALSLYTEAKERAKATPLKIAFSLLELMEAAPPSSTRESLLREAVRAVEAAVPPAAAPKRVGALSLEAKAISRLFKRLRRSPNALLSGVGFDRVEEVSLAGERRIRLSLKLSGRTLLIDLLRARSKMPCFLRSRRFRAVYHDDVPPPTPHESNKLAALLRLIDRSVDTAHQKT